MINCDGCSVPVWSSGALPPPSLGLAWGELTGLTKLTLNTPACDVRKDLFSVRIQGGWRHEKEGKLAFPSGQEDKVFP